MNALKSFDELAQRLADSPKRRRVVLVCPHDSHTEYVIGRALEEGFAEFTLFTVSPVSGNLQTVISHHRPYVRIVECSEVAEACREAVAAVRRGEAEVLMKGTVNTDVLLKAVLDKQGGLLESGRVLSHIAMSCIPAYGKMLMFSDAAVIPCPTLEQFDAIVGYCVEACRHLGIAEPRVALTHFTEKVNPKFGHTVSYQELKRFAAGGRYGNAVVDGPMDVKTALDRESGVLKGIQSPVAGKADVLVFPNIESGNTFYKTITLFAAAEIAGWLAGTVVPVVVASRADSELSKYYSLALACLCSDEDTDH